MIFIHVPFLNVSAIALFPLCLVKNQDHKADKILVNHEKIHFRQQIELLIVPFYVIYLINYLINLIYYQNHNKAYRNIVFEKEAYKKQEDLYYLKSRSLWEFISYL